MSDDQHDSRSARAARIAKKRERNAAVRKARAEQADQQCWRVRGGRWDFGVERLFLVAGVSFAATGLLFTLATTGTHWSVGVVVLVALFALAAGWALARWFGPSAYPTDHLASALQSIVVWLLFGAVAWRLAIWILPNGFGLGSVERWWLAPPIAAVVFAIGARFRLRGWVTFFAALAFALAPVRDSDLRVEGRTVAMSSAIQLQAAQASGHTVLMRSIDAEYSSTPTQPPDHAKLGRVAGAYTCADRAAIDQHHTLLGLPSRVLAYRAQVCFTKDGKPVSAGLDIDSAAGHQVGAFRPVRLESLDPLTPNFGADLGSVPYTYEDRSKTPLPLMLRNAADGTAVFDKRGRPTGFRAGSIGDTAVGTGPDQGNPGNDVPGDTTLLHVTPDGHTVTMLYALESRDPLVRKPESLLGADEPRGEDESDSSPDRLFSLRARDGYATDVLVVTGTFQLGSADVETTIFRATSHGTHVINGFDES